MSDWVTSYDAQIKAEAAASPTAVTKAGSMSFRGGSNSVSIHGYKGPVSSFNGAPPPQHTFGASKAVYANANMNGGYGYSYAMTPQPLPSYGRGQAFTVGGGFRGRGGIPAFQYQIQPGNNPYKYVAPKPSPPGADMMEKPMGPEEVALLNKFLHKKVDLMQNSGIDVSLDRNDPRSPLHSIRSFRDLRLRPELLEALNLLGFTQPSKIQEFALPLLIMEPPTNIIAQSQSGTGKTATFVLTMLSRVDPSNKYPQCLCLAPTYELAIQIGDVVAKMAQFMPDVAVHYAVRGVKPSAPITEQIIIGTPGKLVDYLTKYNCLDASHIRCLVLDEADVMINQAGYTQQSTQIYNIIEEASPVVQTMLFSATYGEDVVKFAMQLIKNAVTVTLKREDQSLPNIKQYFVECPGRDAKYQAVVELYSGLTIASCVIFTHTRRSASWLAERMIEKGHLVGVLHGEMSVEERAASIEQFKEGIFKVLITTNVCARGIDVSQVTIVINYDPPLLYENPTEPDYDTYLHRIGRTGRFGKAGIAINFVDSREALAIIKKIEAFFGKPIPKLDPSDLEQLEAVEND
ncbi:hypothetical protein RB195_020631 [Necator americanus]|uniref:RNA helicase n=1 Tax=Necator americanus TaxID=51031 RepID=A0ABR1CL50_NECAM